MLRSLLVLPLLLVATPASACTIDNCVEVKTATVSWNGIDPHELNARCTVAGRAGVRFSVAAEADGYGDNTVPRSITVRCRAWAGSTLAFDSSASESGPVASLTGGFVSSANIRVCVNAAAVWPDGHTVSIASIYCP